jgi:RNA polymerase sigma factor (sigma-70 family)
MSFFAGTAMGKDKPTRSDAELVAECLRGHESAWTALIAKYKNLIFSIPVKTGFSREEAADIFQSVCLDLLCQLPFIRDPQALAAWLIRVTYNKCFHWRRENARYVSSDDNSAEPVVPAEELPEHLLHEVEREQHLRTAVCELSPRCRLLVEKLFFDLPARPYQQVARELGMALGSVGGIRRRCLENLRDHLKRLGVR